ncbi:hypothetical protein V6C53_02945 [Desulfocurvibacter africanus]|uniref:hypothetical protein n=1 Tax=Desulfocurvibacter africanus TaxID=873 RepID=UPI002FD89D3D
MDWPLFGDMVRFKQGLLDYFDLAAAPLLLGSGVDVSHTLMGMVDSLVAAENGCLESVS